MRALLGTVQPASNGLIERAAQAVKDYVTHEHPTWEDLHCLNLASWMGERMGVVLRRLVDAETRAARYRLAWRLAYQRSIARAGAADRASGRLTQAQEALQQSVFTILAYQMTQATIRETTLREAARTVRQKHSTMPHEARERIGDGVLLAALVLDEAADLAADATPDTDAAPLRTALQARIDDVLTKAAGTGTMPSLDFPAVRQYLAVTIVAGLLGEKDTRDGSQPPAGASTPTTSPRGPDGSA
ncbi:hypothetical protein ACIQU5_27930 [Streptomyces sp. NPDC090306]|uniref:hypothetical protein n=1 Tax=Streptomyces sp. NPDC090306 TaxID=3365961 RepID=UPI00382190E6